jgi:Domain of Unknown Function (DUF748)
MNSNARKTPAVVTAVAVLGITRAVLPWVLTWLANLGIERVPGVSGRVRRVRINFIAPRLVLQDLLLIEQDPGGQEHRIEVDSIAIVSQWKALLTGAFIGFIRIDSPRLSLDIDGFHRNANDSGQATRTRHATAVQQPWQDKVKRLPGFKISPILLTNGQIRVHGVPGEQGSEIAIEHLHLRVGNITNSTDLAPTLMTKISMDARVLTSGKLELRGEGYPLARVPTFNADFSASHIDLTELRSVIEQATEIDVRRGIVSLYLEAAAADGQIRGYAKPVFDHLELAPPKKRLHSPSQNMGSRVSCLAWQEQTEGSHSNAARLRRRCRRSRF